jgi:hypothetical protein
MGIQNVENRTSLIEAVGVYSMVVAIRSTGFAFLLLLGRLTDESVRTMTRSRTCLFPVSSS